MNLTQKQLALLAKVSTPTISRFESDAKHLQLSSVMAILDVLGMTDTRVLAFDPQHARAADGGIVLWGNDGNTRVLCAISRDALDDHFSDRGRLKPAAAFSKHRNEIEGLARRKYVLGQLEPDGSVLIRTQDVT
jgi:transcriptional regulator with XRE-family HTH domain